MTITVAVAAPEGIVIGADSRTTYANPQKWPKVASDYTYKVFQLGPRSAASTFGWAFLNGRNIASLVDDFRDSDMRDDLEPNAVAAKLALFFQGQYETHIKAKLDKPVAKGKVALGFIVGAYGKDHIGRLFICHIPGPVLAERARTDRGGAIWQGDTNVVIRLVKGRDPSLALDKLPDAIRGEVEKLEYIIGFQRFSLQDAIDFVIFLMKATSEMLRFSDGIAAVPGAFPSVGGPLDIARLTRSGFAWVQRKELRGEAVGSATGPQPFTLT